MLKNAKNHEKYQFFIKGVFFKVFYIFHHFKNKNYFHIQRFELHTIEMKKIKIFQKIFSLFIVLSVF